MEQENKKKKLWDIVTDMRGDKVTLIIIIFLFLLSIVALFSSTSLLVTENTTRLGMFREQLLIVVIGAVLIWICYRVKSIEGYINFSKYIIIVPMALLLFLFLGLRIPHVLESEYLNQAWRTIKVLGHFQLHVFEVAKVFMVMYLSWAVHAWKEVDENGENGFHLTKKLAARYNKPWIASPLAEEILYIFIPIGLTTLMVLKGSNSSGIFILIVMVSTILIGGYSFKHTLLVGGSGLIALVLLLLVNEAANGKIIKDLRWGVLSSRIEDLGKFEKDLYAVDASGERILKPGTAAYEKFIDKNRQVQGAKIAIHEGRKMKGPGGSTQKYAVPVIFGDFMYSFIIEEYGLFGGILILVLFGSLLARGCFIAMNCESTYAKTVVGGLTVLISGQALMHILVNVGIIPMTGQTLPLISDGKSAFLMFSIAFGVLLSISKFAKENIEKIEKQYHPDVHESGDEVMDRMNDLEDMESMQNDI